jgi:TetR/AcrR family transcriptional regulator
MSGRARISSRQRSHAGSPIHARSGTARKVRTIGKKVGSTRRRGVENSEVRGALIDAAVQLIRETGYASVTAKSLADKIKLTRAIVHYYFRSMDDLFIAVIRRGFDHCRPRLQAALASVEPLRTLWEINSDPAQATLTLELNALASRRPAVRAEVKRCAEEYRALQTQVLIKHLEIRGISPTLRPLVATVILTSVSQVLTLETAIDITYGHRETLEFVDECLRAFAEGRDVPVQEGS